MGILDTHADGIRSSFDFDVRNPAPDMPAPSFNAWSFAKSGMASVETGLFQAGANFYDLQAATSSANSRQAGNLSQDEQLTDEQRARKAGSMVELQQQAQHQREVAQWFRQKATESMPDPVTTHRADQIMGGVGAGLTRAVGSVATLGPVAGAGVFGLSEGDTAYQDLRSRGVDEKTALKVASVTGAFSAATAGVPAGGSTVLRTMGIAAAAGPVSYMGEQYLSREILKRSGYADEAALHDPTDPLGLTLSTLLPGVMGAMHIRNLPKPADLAATAMSLESGGKRYGADGQILTSPKGAQGEMQVMPATATDPGFGVRPAAVGPDGKVSPDELARVGRDYVGAMWERYGDPEKTLAAYNAGPGAVDAAIKAHGADWLAHMPEETRNYVAKGMKEHVARGVDHAAQNPAVVDAARVSELQRVLVDSLPDHPDAMPALSDAMAAVAQGHFDLPPSSGLRADLEAQLAGVEAERSQLIPEAANLAEPGAIRQARSEMAQLQRDVPDTSDAAIQQRAKEIQSESRLSYKQARAQASQEIAQAAGDFQRRIDRLQKAIDDNARAQQATQRLGELDQQHAELTQRIAQEPLSRPVPRATTLAAREAIMRPDSPTIEAPRVPPAMHEARIPEQPAQPQESAQAPTAQPAPAKSVSPAAPRAEPAAGQGVSPIEQRADAAIAENPELRVQLPGSDETISAAEAMQRARDDALREASDGHLVRAALQCALSFL